MSEDTMEMQEYFESYVPTVVGKILAEKPVDGMEGTTFSTQVSIEGEKTMVFGVTIKDAMELKVQSGALESPMLAVTLPESILKPATRQMSQMVGRKQYDELAKAKGTLTVEMEMPGDWVLPIKITFNGAADPRATLRGPVDVLQKVMSGELNGPEAFMGGKIKMDGDMMFLMSLSALAI